MNRPTLFFLSLLFPVCLYSQTDIKPVPFTDVHIADGFWRQRLDTMQRHTIPYAFRKVEEAGQIRNFEYAGMILSGKARKGELRFQSGQPYDDAEVYKVLEGASYVLTVSPDAELERYCDSVIDKICAAQEPDGYLQTNWTIANPLHEWYGGEKWLNDWNLSHETFNVGELVECAIAYYQATGKDKLLKCAIRAADNLCDTFNDKGIRMAPGHAVVEMALVRLYELTSNRRYLEECKFFLDCRGLRKFDPSSDDYRVNGKYWQDHLPATEQREAVGHAVRALYFYSGMADWVRYSGDEAYRKAIDGIWENIVSKKLYITGGLGARDQNEAFGSDYELPNATAYCETCASVANCMFQLRMFRLTGDARYIDILERSLYNTVLDGYSFSGDRFYYPNRLQTSSRGQERSQWFGTSCCPTNLCRLIPSVPGYVYATSNVGDIYVNLYIGSTAEVALGGKSVRLEQRTLYPWEGNVTITVKGNDAGRFNLRLRLPGWAQGRPIDSDLYTYVDTTVPPVTITVNGKAVAYTTERGYAVLTRQWQDGDVVALSLPMKPRLVKAHSAVADDNGLLAAERGPIVYCAEFADNGGSISAATLSEKTHLKVERLQDQSNSPLNGIPTLRHRKTTLIPYFARAYRGKGEMSVWLPDEKQLKKPGWHTIDKVTICDETSEESHKLEGENMRTGPDLGWRDATDGGWIGYALKCHPRKPNRIVAKYWGSDGGDRRFNIICEGETIATEHVDNCHPGQYYEVAYTLPPRLTKGKHTVSIRLQALPGNTCGGLFGLRTEKEKKH